MDSSVSIQICRRLEPFIPPLAALAIVKGLRFQRWTALLVYLMAAEVIGCLMEQVASGTAITGENDNKVPNQLGGSKLKQELEGSSPGCQVVHQMPGRIRLKIPPLKTEPEWGKKIEQLVNLDERITSVRVNPVAASVVIHYRPEIESKRGCEELLELIQWVRGKQGGEKDGCRQLNASLNGGLLCRLN